MNLKKKVVTSIATIGLVGALVGGATLAMFTDTESTAASFTAGKVDLGLCPETKLAEPVNCMAPGDSKVYNVTLSNQACLDLWWKVDVDLNGALASGNTPLTAGLYEDIDCTIPVNEGQAYSLAANTPNKILYVKVALPKEADNSYSLDTANLSLTFDAVQKKNNEGTTPFEGVNIINAEAPDMMLP